MKHVSSVFLHLLHAHQSNSTVISIGNYLPNLLSYLIDHIFSCEIHVKPIFSISIWIGVRFVFVHFHLAVRQDLKRYDHLSNNACVISPLCQFLSNVTPFVK
jgi:Ni,Fe-hydrogenase I cytochrome b subunit